MLPSKSHLLLLPTFNTGPRLLSVVTEALAQWQPILAVVDGSTGGSAEAVRALARREPAFSVVVLPKNQGKGAAVLAGAWWARAGGSPLSGRVELMNTENRGGGVASRRAMIRGMAALGFLAAAALSGFSAEESGPRVALGAPEWRQLKELYARGPDGVATFEERRYFPFRKEPIVLRGEVRASRRHGLSLNYLSPDPRIMILDERGVLVREAGRDKPPPSDPRAAAVNQVMFNLLRLDFAALEKAFEIFGARGDGEWSLTLVPREESFRRSLGDVYVGGDDVSVRRIELKRSAKQRVVIEMTAPRTMASFPAEEVKKYFR